MLTRTQHDYHDLIQLFNHCFHPLSTRLVKGGREPLYTPANEDTPYHTLYFAHGFYASALHEIAHWLIAGKKRRNLLDFGYWYQGDGRNMEQQRLFEHVEAKPQAMEWILSRSCGFRFQISLDNLSGASYDPARFKQSVYQQVLVLLESGLNRRAAQFQRCLSEFYQVPNALDSAQYSIDDI